MPEVRLLTSGARVEPLLQEPLFHRVTSTGERLLEVSPGERVQVASAFEFTKRGVVKRVVDHALDVSDCLNLLEATLRALALQRPRWRD
jgi:hypothetical protein